ncbi:MAG: EF-P beta-lysylation protein EpmB [Porticoccaceae bacterium]|nr:MAG: EF-P beta-lysylation protein EpmB [Porticoccaceae bacterium]
MIAQRAAAVQTAPWKIELRRAVTGVAELLRLLDLDPAELDPPPREDPRFPLRVPLSYVRRMRRGDPRDPLLLQVLPTAAEQAEMAGFVPDPLAERSHNPRPGVIHKYRARVLLLVTGACAVHCRYCFRRHFPYGDNALAGPALEAALAYLAEDSSIREVILSGGDPLAAADGHLARLLEALEAIPHLVRLRVHTRLPVVLPARLDESLAALLGNTRFATTVVLHANHPNEVDDELARGVRLLRETGIHVLNQSVLLARVNDDAAILAELSERLFAAGVLPYYLHLLDPVAGAHHFAVAEGRARALYRELQAALPGYLVPRLVRELPGRPAKTLIAP